MHVDRIWILLLKIVVHNANTGSLKQLKKTIMACAYIETLVHLLLSPLSRLLHLSKTWQSCLHMQKPKDDELFTARIVSHVRKGGRKRSVGPLAPVWPHSSSSPPPLCYLVWVGGVGGWVDTLG